MEMSERLSEEQLRYLHYHRKPPETTGSKIKNRHSGIIIACGFGYPELHVKYKKVKKRK